MENVNNNNIFKYAWNDSQVFVMRVSAEYTTFQGFGE